MPFSQHFRRCFVVSPQPGTMNLASVHRTSCGRRIMSTNCSCTLRPMENCSSYPSLKSQNAINILVKFCYFSKTKLCVICARPFVMGGIKISKHFEENQLALMRVSQNLCLCHQSSNVRKHTQSQQDQLRLLM